MTSPSRTSRVAVLASGGGSNLEALLDFLAREPDAGARVTLVASDRADAGALERARRRGIPTAVIGGGAAAAGGPLETVLDPAQVDLVVLAGYLRLVPAHVVARFRGRILNVHPALLPAFGGAGMYGLHVHRAVLDSGARVSGPTVHFVDEHYDRGAIVAQWPVPVHRTDTAESLAARVLRAEHALLPRVVREVACGRIGLGDDGRVQARAPAEPGASGGRSTFVLTDDANAVAAGIERLLSV